MSGDFFAQVTGTFAGRTQKPDVTGAVDQWADTQGLHVLAFATSRQPPPAVQGTKGRVAADKVGVV